MRTRILVLFAVAVGAFVVGGGVVVAGQPVGFSASVKASGTIAKATEIGANGIEFQSRKNATVIVQEGNFQPSGSSGWHTHPGLTVVTVTSGTVINHTRCHVTTYTVGQSFVEPPKTLILVDNASSTATAQVYSVLVVPEGMPARNSNVTPPDCTHPKD